MATASLAAWAMALRYSTLPPSVVAQAVRSFYNLAGCAVGGSAHPAAAIARASVSPFAGPSTSSVLGCRGHRTDANSAALLNGISSHVHDYDDTHLDTIIHPAGPVVSALLAVAEMREPVNGKDFILALVAGIEAECKAGLAVWPHHYDVGWHITSTSGSIGAAVAVGKLLNLDIEAMQHAIGIAATQVTGLREQFGSMTKSFHPGRAAQNGLLAAFLASNGYDSSLQSLEAKRGWANVVSASNDIEARMDTLGKTWEILKNSFKPFPCGIVIHPVIDACVQIYHDMNKDKSAERSLDASLIQSVHVEVHPLVLELTGKKTPRTGLEGKFSVYHSAAVALLYGKATPAQYEDAVVQNPAVIQLRERVEATVNNELRTDETKVVVRFKRDAFEKHVEHAVGSVQVPMTNEQLEEKFLDQVSSVLGQQQAKKASQVCWNLENVTEMKEITLELQ